MNHYQEFLDRIREERRIEMVTSFTEEEWNIPLLEEMLRKMWTMRVLFRIARENENNAYLEGYYNGYGEGFQDAHEAGRKRLRKVYKKTLKEGRKKGYQEGFRNGYQTPKICGASTLSGGKCQRTAFLKADGRCYDHSVW